MQEFDVPAVSCGHCVKAVTEAVRAVDAGARVDVDLDARKVRVEGVASREALAAALAEAGYPPGR